MDKIEIMRGLVMPFSPMLPSEGRSIRTSKAVNELCTEIEDKEWICQPNVNGDRACIGVLDKRVYIQDHRGGWYPHSVKNVSVYAELPNRTCLDGVVLEGNFYPFECLAVGGNLFTFFTTDEREIAACMLMRLINQPWIFDTPSKEWLLKRRANLPKFEGVIMKRSNAPYAFQTCPNKPSPDWLKRNWV